MTGNGLSPDGRHQWDGDKWVPIPAPPKTPMDRHAYFQIFCVFLIVIVVMAVLVLLFGSD